MYCVECGAMLIPRALFCIRCGLRIASEEEVEATFGRRLERWPPDPPPEPAPAPDASEGPDEPAVEGLAPALAPAWHVLLPDGTRIAVVLPLVLGRKPRRDGLPESARLVPVQDPEGTVSRSHALVEPVGDGIRLTNLSKKNTIPIAWPDGVRHHIPPGGDFVIASTCAAKLGVVPVLLQRA